MVHTCCTPKAEKERIFSEAADLGAGYVRVDVELDGIFTGLGPHWGGLDQVIALSKQYDLPVLAVLLTPRNYDDADEFASRSGEIVEHAGSAIDHWEVLNEPDGDWAFAGTAEDYARILSATYDAIKAKAPGATIVLGGLMRPHEPEWLQRVFDTPGADAVHKFDIANVHLRGPVDAVVRRYGEFRSWLAERGFTGPLWVTELGYAADPAFQSDPAYRGGDAPQAAYYTQALLGLGEVGAPQVFATLHDGGLDGEYATEGLERLDETPGGDYPVTRRPSFAAVRRLVDDWDQLMAWRSEQREHEQGERVEQAKSALWSTDAGIARDKFREARAQVHTVQGDLARMARANRAARGDRASRAARVARADAAARKRSPRATARLERRLARARALFAGCRAALAWKSAIAHWHSQRAYDHAVAVALLKQRIAGG